MKDEQQQQNEISNEMNKMIGKRRQSTQTSKTIQSDVFVHSTA